MTLPASARSALQAARDAEREQIAWYRALAVVAERAGDDVAAERINGLLADEQHHFSRLVARLMELGAADRVRAAGAPATAVAWPDWESEARRRERVEIDRYQALLRVELDEQTQAMIEEFLAAERRHAEELGGKWMGA